MQRGKRPPKISRTPGRLPSISPKYCIQHIRQVAPPPFIPSNMDIEVCELDVSVPVSEFNCPICFKVLRSPIQLVNCGSVVCAECLCSKIGDSLVCPCCNSDHLQNFSTSIRPPPPLVVKVIGGLCIVCKNCNTHMQLREYRDHIASKNCTTSPQQVLPHTSIDEILHQPLTTPLTALEQKLQTTLAKRSIAGNSEEGVLQLKTGGTGQAERGQGKTPGRDQTGRWKRYCESSSSGISGHESRPQHSLEQAEAYQKVERVIWCGY